MRSRFGMLLVALTMPLVACGGDDGVGVEGDTPTEAEAEALAEFILEIGFVEAFEGLAGLAAAPSRIPVNISETFSTTVPCEFGGGVAVSVELAATGDTETEVMVDFTVTQTHDGCVASPETSTVQFTLDGNPNVVLDFSATVDAVTFAVDASGSLDGAVDWASDDGRSGTCPVDVTFTVSLDATGAGTATTSGQFCGRNVSATEVIEA